MFRLNDAAITALVANTSRCWLTYAVDPTDTKDFNELFYTSLDNSTTTDDEAYNLLSDYFTDWLQGRNSLSRFASYNIPNWDGYGADPITNDTIKAARQFMKMLPKNLGDPEMAPGSDGIIALEWLFQTDHPLRKLFIDVGPGNVWSAYFRRSDGTKKTIPQQEITKETKNILKQLFNELGT
jgi:hypothetical protein